MPLRFAMLASGSSGIAGWLQVGSYGILIDAGLGPRLLAQRLSAVGASWRQISAVLLTHTHGDHTGSNAFFPATVDVVAQENTKTNMEKMDVFKDPKNKHGLPHRTPFGIVEDQYQQRQQRYWQE